MGACGSRNQQQCCQPIAPTNSYQPQYYVAQRVHQPQVSYVSYPTRRC